MNERLRLRFWIEVGTALASSSLCLVTTVRHDWIELAFRVDPDQSSGSLEWLLVAATLSIAVVTAFLARREWGRRQSVTV